MTSLEKTLQALCRLGLARSRDLEREGISRTELRRLLGRGQIERVGRDPLLGGNSSELD